MPQHGGHDKHEIHAVCLDNVPIIGGETRNTESLLYDATAIFQHIACSDNLDQIPQPQLVNQGHIGPPHHASTTNNIDPIANKTDGDPIDVAWRKQATLALGKSPGSDNAGQAERNACKQESRAQSTRGCQRASGQGRDAADTRVDGLI